jgi:hypothetical protein
LWHFRKENFLGENVVRNFSVVITLLTLSVTAQALDILGRPRAQGGQGVNRGLVALYNFRDVVAGQPNQIPDVSGVGAALNLEILGGTSIVRRCDKTFYDPVTRQRQTVCYLDFQDGGLVRSVATASKIAGQCKSSNALTVETWIRNDRADELTKEGRLMPLKILTLGRTADGTNNNRYLGSSNDANFFLGLDYDMAAQYTGGVRQGPRQARAARADDGFNNLTLNNDAEAAKYELETSHVRVNSPDTMDNRILAKDKLQHVVFTVRNDGRTFLYVSAASEGDGEFENPFELIPIVRDERAGPNNVNSRFAGWGDDVRLGLGNELTYASTQAPFVTAGRTMAFRTERREWRGEMYLLAVYCDHHTDTEILGDAAPGAGYKSYPPNPNVTVTPLHTEAAKLYARLTGVKIPVTAPIISGVNDPRVPDENYAGDGMVQRLQANNALGAAQLAVTQDGFYNITVKDFAKRMSTRDETVNTPLNDFTAMIVGVARDNIDARQILSGNFFYRASSTRTAAPGNMLNDLLMSNNHYERLEAMQYNLAKVLERVNGQKITNGTGVVDHPDPAGVLTARAFLAAHAVAGTNRRIVEYSFRSFACIPITGWADSTGPDNRIGQDVDRYPGGDHKTFLTSCRSCHSNMDGLRPAFAKVHFNNGYVKHADIVTSTVMREQDETPTTMCQNPRGVACKMNRNDTVFPDGFEVRDNGFINNAFRGGNTQYFGWSTAIQGQGMRQYGEMLANSRAFPGCMARRAFRAVCKREPASIDNGLIDQAAQQFVNDGYSLRNLFARIAVSRECSGD